MMKKMRVKTYLILSFVLILSFMVVLGSVSSFFTQRLSGQTITFYEQPHTIQTEVAEIRRIMSDIGSLLRRAIIYQTPETDKYSQDAISANIAEMGTRIALVKERFAGDQQLISAADASVAIWLAEIDKLNQMMDANQYEESKLEFSSVYQPIEQDMQNKVIAISDYSATISEDFYAQAKSSRVTSIWIISSIVVVTILLSIWICSDIIFGIMIPLNKVLKAADSMSKGDLHSPLDYTANNEFGQLVNSIKHTEKTLSSYVNNIDYVLDRMSKNDLTVQLEMDYVGDFSAIRQSLEKILYSMNNSMSQISESALQVTTGASQVSDSAQILSSSSTEQAGSVEQLSSNLDDVSQQVEYNAKYTAQTRELVNNVGVELGRGNEQMQQMLAAMSDINNSSAQIAKIIKTIEDIAFQTNILALNAAVEAARAGAAGKGFAVVADEVRNLAGKSAEAAKSTTQLIQNSMHAVENGTRVADGTAATLSSVVTRAQEITVMVSKISVSSDEQALHLAQISEVVAQITQNIQTNSATAEESAAASEELNGQAQLLNSLVDQFKLKPLDNRSSVPIEMHTQRMLR